MVRKSNFEAYRIMCILLIVVMHTFGNPADELNQGIGILVNVVGNIGVTGFVLLSGYFGVKLNVKKLIKLDVMMIFWSVLGAVCLMLVPVIAYNPGMRELLQCIIPVLSHKYWFLSAYFALCLLSPFINEYLDKIDRKRFVQLILVMGAIFLVAPTLVGFDQTGDGGKGILNMILAYIIGRFIGIYYKDVRVRTGKWIGVFVVVVAVNFVLNFVAFKLTGSTANYYARDNSVFTMAQAVILLVVFMQMNFTNKFVNLLAANVVAVYVLEDTIKTLIYGVFPEAAAIYGAGHVWVVLLISLVTFVVASGLEAVRKGLFGKLEDFIIDKLISKVKLWQKQ